MQDKGYNFNSLLTRFWMVHHKASWSTDENNLKLAQLLLSICHVTWNNL